jgi:hypothetical protein
MIIPYGLAIKWWYSGMFCPLVCVKIGALEYTFTDVIGLVNTEETVFKPTSSTIVSRNERIE